MKMAGRVTWFLDSIDDLKNIDFGGSVPQHSLVLLYWFAHTVDIVGNSIRLTFDPDNDEYGAHHFGNFENMLDLPRGYKYYTVGNLKDNILRPLPDYVVNPPTLSNEGNRDRIIFSVRNQWINQVYITQHYGNSDIYGTEYDPNCTYHITTNLLRQIREFSMGGNYQTLLSLHNRFGSNADVSSIINTWGRLACLGLFLSIVRQRNVYRAQLQSGRTGNSNISRLGTHELSWNTRSGINHTPHHPDDNQCLMFLLFLVFIVFFLVVCALSK
uniref:Uncharacterized protein n=1 Tax=Labrus bergylta TaxID=56723 RepID=A0A3Q3GZ82_9LABR